MEVELTSNNQHEVDTVHRSTLVDEEKVGNLFLCQLQCPKLHVQLREQNTHSDLKQCLIYGTRDSHGDIVADHISQRVHLCLPDCRSKHDEDGDNVNRAPSNSKCKWDEDDASDGQCRHVGSVGVIEIGIADPKLGVEDLPEWNRDAKAAIRIFNVSIEIFSIISSLLLGEAPAIKRRDKGVLLRCKDHQCIEAKNDHMDTLSELCPVLNVSNQLAQIVSCRGTKDLGPC